MRLLCICIVFTFVGLETLSAQNLMIPSELESMLCGEFSNYAQWRECNASGTETVPHLNAIITKLDVSDSEQLIAHVFIHENERSDNVLFNGIWNLKIADDGSYKLRVIPNYNYKTIVTDRGEDNFSDLLHSAKQLTKNSIILNIFHYDQAKLSGYIKGADDNLSRILDIGPDYIRIRQFRLNSVRMEFERNIDSVLEMEKCVYYEGWAAIRNETSRGEFQIFRNLRFHNKGQTVKLVTGQGDTTKYSLRLEQISNKGNQVRNLRLSLLKHSLKEPVLYIWGDERASSLGMNLNWFQIGLKKCK